MNAEYAENKFVFERCREVQALPNNHLDLWAREHFKSTIITYALTIQNILNDPEVTVGIFSHTRPIAKGFLRQVKREFEGNELLKELFPDILWENPRKEAPKWSEDDGLIVRRQGNPKEATIEAWGLVDGQPTSKHYKLMVYDDVVTRESVTTPEMIGKVTEAWELSRNLASDGGTSRYIGTRYHFNDTYRIMMQRGIEPRIYPATEDGTVEGVPVMMSRDLLDQKRREMGPYTFGTQMLQNPKADETQGFKEDWLRFYHTINPWEMNRFILVDPASEKKKQSDYTAAFVLGAGPDRNLYIIDVVRDRLNLTQRTELIFKLHRKWKPMAVGYEKYGMMADVENIRNEMERQNYRFSVTELGGPMPKTDRIRRLIPHYEQGRIYWPDKIWKTNYEGTLQDLTQIFIEEEFKPFPVPLHDDLLDAMARIYDLMPMGIPWPEEQLEDGWEDSPYNDADRTDQTGY